MSEFALNTTNSPAKTYLSGLAPGSRRTMRHALDTMAGLASGGKCDADSFPWAELKHQHVLALRSALAEQYAPTTANKMLSALRQTLKATWRLGLLSSEDYQRVADVPAVRGTALLRGRAVGAIELRALFAVCAADESPAGRRDAAALALLYGAGLRRSEVVALDADDFDTETGAIRVRGGKGRKDRLAYVSPSGRKAVTEWLKVRGAEAGAMLCPVNKAGHITARRLSSQAIYNMLAKRARQGQLEHFSPHDLRRSFVSDLLDAGADVSLVQQLVGHANVGTTQRYDRRPETAKRKAAGLLQVPFVGTGARPASYYAAVASA